MTPVPVASRSRMPGWLLYGVLALLFAFNIFYQIRFTRQMYFAGPRLVTGMDIDARHVLVQVREGSALKVGDVLERVNGLPFRGWAQIDRARYLASPGDLLFLDVNSGGLKKLVKLPWREANVGQSRSRVQSAVVLFVTGLLPWVVLLFGFWVVALRPRDAMAWLFLGIMLSFCRSFQLAGGGWEDGLRQATTVFNQFLSNCFSAWFLLLGLYFGYRWPGRRLFVLGWSIATFTFAFALLTAIETSWQRERGAEAAGLGSLVSSLGVISNWLDPLSIGLFLYFLFGKYRAATSPDLKRRLRILLTTMMVSVAPVGVVIFWRNVILNGDDMLLPESVQLLVYLLIALIPLSLAYVILVHRAVDVGVAIRTGLQYTMARGGVFFLQLVVAVIGIIWAVRYMENQHHLGSSVHAMILGAYAALLFGVRWISGPLFRWIDRRFFRDAYSSEQVMADLTEKVRTVLDPQELFETVSDRLRSALHVQDVTFFLPNGTGFQPAYATGLPTVSSFPHDSAPVQRLSAGHEPMQLFLDDSACWCYEPSVSAADRERLISLGTQVLLPLNSADRLVGFASLGPKRSEEPYTRNDLRLLKAVGTQAGLALENSRLAESLANEAAQQERVHRELEIASEVQQRLFPRKSLVTDRVELAGLCRPALAVGGDYFDYFRLEGDLVGLAVGDVAGKGLGAALVMATLQASLRTQVLDGGPDLASLMSRLNQVVYEASTRNRFATLFYAQYDQASRVLTYVNAGHNPPFVLRSSGEVERLRLTGIAVGLQRKRAYQQATVTLEPGDVLVAFTDGISEAMDAEREEWGEERLAACVALLGAKSPADAIAAIVASADAFVSGAAQHDDMTMVVLRVNA